MKRLFLIVFCLVPWAIALAGLGWLMLKRFPPSGVVTFDVPFDGRSAWVDPFLPGERVTSPGPQDDGAWRGQRIISEPVYASARVPGVYDDVELAVEFRTIRQPLVELGVIRGADVSQIESRPIWLSTLQTPEWKKSVDGYVRPAANAPVVAVWHASTTLTWKPDPTHGVVKTRVTLRGAHDFYALPAGGALSFTFEIQDANRASGADNIAIRVLRGSEEIARDTVTIGGSRDKGLGPVVSKTVDVPHPVNDVYRIQLISDDDVFIRSVATNAVHWVVGPRLSFGDDVGFEPTTRPGIAWTDSRHFVLETFHNEGLQTVTVGRDKIAVVRTHDVFRLDRSDADVSPQRLNAPRGDVRVVGDGWFSFTPDAWFAPQPRRMTDATDPVKEGITHVVTPYERPQDIGDGWVRAVARFRLEPSQDRIRLALSAPGLLSRSGAVDIRRVTLTYRRPPLSWNEWWRVVRHEAVNAIRRLRASL